MEENAQVTTPVRLIACPEKLAELINRFSANLDMSQIDHPDVLIGAYAAELFRAAVHMNAKQTTQEEK